MTRKVFTIDEANGLVPALERIFARIEGKKRTVRRTSKKIEVLHVLWGDKIDDDDNPDRGDFLRYKKIIGKAINEIETMIDEEIVGRGLRFPVGGIENGLIDFPTTYEGRWVYLCWRAGEPELLYWHETDAGFPGRRKITDQHREHMGADEVDDDALDF